ncbi:hypothetical protein SmJEL517_g01897 [Synchytrium microbalum]|uniref:Cilia- and flagella-associated protein 57 n=1 Tax=Synchytrium microbalum TaxID=1806994 RepID=A0A507C8X2_9FUNG|nr:uncharacterized protein SmJEL517_g01897 [Synchytrium microbalum]TPX35788.1 hypothetical protein SmJEL517_g01897 [Synchytrium microbalum]
MALPFVSQSHIYGINTHAAAPIHRLSNGGPDMILFYSAGSQLVVHNLETKTQKFISCGSDGEVITAIGVSANGTYAAAALSNGNGPASILVCDLTTMRKKKIVYAEAAVKTFIFVAFSDDGKLLLAQSAGPEWNLYCWAWEKPKLITSIKTSTHTAVHGSDADLRQAAINPFESSLTQIAICGDHLFRVFTLVDSHFKMTVQHKPDKNLLCLAWLSDTRIACGTDDGHVLVFEGNDVLLDLQPTMPTNFKSEIPVSVTALASHGLGLAVGLSTGHCISYDKNDNAESLYAQSRIYITSPSQLVNSISIGHSEDLAVCIVNDGGVFEVPLLGEDPLEGVELPATRMLQRFHSGSVVGLDVCIRKPMFVTCGTDKTARVWNYLEGTVDAVANFEEEPTCIALHPSGHYMFVGFPDCVRMFNVLCDDIRPFWENPSVGCREARFSHGGQFFAMSVASAIEIRSSWTCEVVMTLTGHEGRIRSITWSGDDARLISTAMDGSIIEWSLLNRSRDSGCVRTFIAVPSSEVLYSCVSYSPDENSVYATANDASFKEFSRAGLLVRDVPMKTLTTPTVQLSNSRRMLFTSTATGALRALRFPLPVPKQIIHANDDAASETSPQALALPTTSTNPTIHTPATQPLSVTAQNHGSIVPPTPVSKAPRQPQSLIVNRQDIEHVDHASHSIGVSKLRSSYDDAFLFSAGEDGSVIVWKVVDRTTLPPAMKVKEMKEMILAKKEPVLAYGDDVMVTKSDLREMAKGTSVLKQQVEDIRKSNEARLKDRDDTQTASLKELTDKFDAEFVALKEFYDSLIRGRIENQSKFERLLEKIRENAANTRQEAIKSFAKRMEIEIEKQNDIQTTSREEKQAWEKQIKEDELEYSKTFERIREQNEARIAEKSADTLRLRIEISKCNDSYSQTISDLSSTSSEEMIAIQVQNEEKLAIEREGLTSIIAENNATKATFQKLNLEIISCRSELSQFGIEEKKLRERMKRLERELELQKKELGERDSMMRDKDGRVIDLKNKNRELEKFKFVLDYKIQEMKKQIEPKEANVVELAERIKYMEAELHEYQLHYHNLLRENEQVHQKFKAICQVRDDERDRVIECSSFRDRIRDDVMTIYKLSRKDDVNAFKLAAITFLHKYNPPTPTSDSDLLTASAKQGTSKSERESLLRHRDLLEHGVSTLRRTVAAKMDQIDFEERRAKTENLALTNELNDLRRSTIHCLNRLRALGVDPAGDNVFEKRERLPPLA